MQAKSCRFVLGMNVTLFEERYKEVASDDSYEGLTKRGNLLLLMDRCAEAEEALRAAWLKAWPSDKAHAAEDLCRAMRAADGGTGRALAWLELLDR